MASKLNVLLLFDLSIPIQPEEYPEYLKTEDWKAEADVLRALNKLGHEVRLLGLHNDLRPLFEEIHDNRPDLVFNLCEAFADDRYFEPNIVSLLELMSVKYTGSPSTALRLCKDKGLTKKVLSYHRIHLPKFIVSPKSRPIKGLKRFPYPAFIKPLKLEGSEGISQVSFANNEKDALERVRFINENLGVDAIVDEYIDGREIYVSILGNERVTVFPTRELFFKQVPEGEPKFATFRAKWNEAYRKKWGINTGWAKPFPPEVQDKMVDISKKIYHVLQLRAYGRIDLRVTEKGEVFFIEANPNPSIAKADDFALSADRGGMDYESLIAKLIQLAGA